MKTISLPLPEDWFGVIQRRAATKEIAVSEEIRRLVQAQLEAEGESVSPNPTKGIKPHTEVTILLRLKSREHFMARIADLRNIPGVDPAPERASCFGHAFASGKIVKLTHADVGLVRLVQQSPGPQRLGWSMKDAAWHMSTCADLPALQKLLA